MDVLIKLALLAWGTIPYFLAGTMLAVPVMRKIGEKENPVLFYSSSFFFGYGLLIGAAKLITTLDIPVRHFAAPLMGVMLLSSAICFVYEFRRDRKGLFRMMRPPLWFAGAAVLVFIFVNFGYLSVPLLHYQMDDHMDLFYYLNNAEALRTLPYSTWEKLYSSGNQLWLGWAAKEYNGFHRISMGEYIALTAQMAGTEAAAATGAAGNFCMLSIFLGAASLVNELLDNKKLAAAAALWAALNPASICAMLECYLPMSFFIGALLFFCVMSVKTILEPGVIVSAAMGIFLGAVLTTLLDGVYLLMGLSLLVFFSLLVTNEVFFYTLPGLLGSWAAAIVLNIPFLGRILEELTFAMGRKALDPIYYFAYSVKILTYSFFGTLMTGWSDAGIFAVKMLSLLLFIAGFLGLAFAFYRKRRICILNLLAVFFCSFVFISQSESYKYAFYKLFQFSFPGILIGIWLLWEMLLPVAREENRRTPNLFFKSLPAVSAVFIFLTSLFSVYNAFLHIYRCSIEYTNEGDSMTVLYPTEDGRPDWELYEEIREESGRDILYVQKQYSGQSKWFMHWARRNRLYFIDTNSYLHNRSMFSSWKEVNPKTEVPLDAEIRVEYGDEEAVLNSTDRENTVLMLLYHRDGDTIAGMDNYIAFSDEKQISGISALKLAAFAREEKSAILTLNLSTTKAKGTDLSIGAVTYHLEAAEDIRIALTIPEGFSNIEIGIPEDTELLVNSYDFELEE
ncbi:MAG: hypothetical protein K6E30_04200 [Lachnospiraceae bacterium]|nr:hypothetical protein [Lachnospiraceae bacterium]